ncbi:hypothetical protein ACYOEI_10865, partial [Singulisphaera rosea]
AHSALAVLKRVCEDPPRPLRQNNPEVPVWLERLISRLLAKDPADRIQTATEVANSLEQGLARHRDMNQGRVEETSGSVRPSRETPLRPSRSLFSRPWIFAVGLVLLMVVGLGGSEAVGLTKVREAVATILRIRTPEGVLVVKADDPNLNLQINGETLVIGGAGVQEIRLRPGVHRVRALRGQQPIQDSLVTIQKGRREILEIGVVSDVGIVGVDRGEAEGPANSSAASVVKADLPWVEGKPSLVWSLAFLPEGNRLAIGQEAFDGTSTLRLHDLVTKKSLDLGAKAQARSVDVSPDGRRLAAGCFDGHLLVYDLEVNPPCLILDQDADGETINVVRFTHDGRHVISGTWQGHVRWHHLATSTISRAFDHPSEVYALAIDHSDSILAVAGESGMIQLIDPTSGKVLHNLLGHGGPVESLAFSADGRLASGSWDRTVRLWDPRAGTLVSTLTGHRREVLCVRFSPDGRLLASSEGKGDGGDSNTSSFDCRIVIHAVQSGVVLHNIQAHLNSIYTLAFSPEGWLASGSMDKSVKLWNPATGALRDMFVPGIAGMESDVRPRPSPVHDDLRKPTTIAPATRGR